MNVFEDLVVELQQENLLEPTVKKDDSEEETNAFHETEVPNPDEEEFDADDEVSDDLLDQEEEEDEDSDDDEETSPQVLANAIHETDEPNAPADAPAPPNSDTGKEFFKKKAIGEVASLQMVEHVLTGVEREYMKVVPKVFDDFNAKKALNNFINGDDDASSEEHAGAEFALMQETEAWCTALAARDREIPVFALRQYCERTRPALSSQPVLALGRFYRNLPYSESVRAKFDFVITRLFSRSIGQQKRACLFNREEMLGHLNTLYKDWSSIPLYDADDDESNVKLTAMSFEDLANEAESASAFDELIESDFFGRLKMFKESISELFYAPQVTVAAISANIRIGNRYVDLIDNERQKLDADSVRTKYGDQNDGPIAEMTGKTLDLAALLRELTHGPEREEEEQEEAPAPAPRNRTSPAIHRSNEPRRTEARKDQVIEEAPAVGFQQTAIAFLGRLKKNAFAVNKGILVVSAVMITVAVLFNLWSDTVGEQVPTSGISTVEIQSTALKPFVKIAKAGKSNLDVYVEPTWETLPKEKRLELLREIYQLAQDKDCTQASVISSSGVTIGFASATRMDVPNL